MGNRVIFLPLVEPDGKLPVTAQNGEAYHSATGALFMKLDDGTVVNCVEAALKEFGSAIGAGQALNFGDSGEVAAKYDVANKRFVIDNTVNGGEFLVQLKNAAGEDANVIMADGSGKASLYHPATNGEVLYTNANGIVIPNPTSAGGLSVTFTANDAILYSTQSIDIKSDDTIDITSGTKTASFMTTGDLRVSGNIIAHFSDERLKTGFTKIGAAMHKVNQLEGVFYSPNEKAVELGFDSLDTQLVGLRAQQVLKVLPEAVTDIGIESGEGEGDMFLTVQYEKLVPLLVEAIKELSAEVEALKSK